MVANDELELILTFIGDYRDWVRASAVCRQWHAVASSDRVWQLLLDRYNVPMTLDGCKQSFAVYARRYAGFLEEYSIVSRAVKVLQTVNPHARASCERNPPFCQLLKSSVVQLGTWQPSCNRQECLLMMLYHLFTDMTAHPRQLQRCCAACFGFFISYNDVFALHLMNHSAVEVLPFNTTPFVNVAAFAWSPDMEEGLGLVLEGHLCGHVIRYGKTYDSIHRMGPIPAESVPYMDLGVFESWLTTFANQIEQHQRKVLFANAEIRAPSGFLETGPGVGVLVTQGIRVHISTLFMLTLARVVYRVTFTYLNNECKHSSVQLTRRHWAFRYTDGRVAEVDGEGVVGHYPELSASKAHFSYCSYSDGGEVHDEINNEGPPHATTINCVESLEGYFEFVPGTIAEPTGPPLRIVIPFVRFIRPLVAFPLDD